MPRRTTLFGEIQKTINNVMKEASAPPPAPRSVGGMSNTTLIVTVIFAIVAPILIMFLMSKLSSHEHDSVPMKGRYPGLHRSLRGSYAQRRAAMLNRRRRDGEPRGGSYNREKTLTRIGPNETSLGTNILYGGDRLYPNQSIISNNGRYHAVFQTDGNFVIYDGPRSDSNPIWASGTQNKGGTLAQFGGDGNLVVFAGGTSPEDVLWQSNPKEGGNHVVMGNDGDLQTKKSDRTTVIWRTKKGDGL